MQTSVWHKVVVGAMIWVSAGLTAASCGSSDDTGPGDEGSDCSFGGKKCDLGCSATLGCVECVLDLDCGRDKPACVLGRCTQCSGNADCPTGQACFPKDHRCEAACTTKADCGDGDEPFCNPLSGACVGCLVSADCEGGKRICEPTRSRCSECSVDLDCGGDKPICDLQDGECHECLVDAHCRGAALCGADHKCHEVCTLDLDCADLARPHCDVEKNSCVACLADTDCSAAAPLCDDKRRCVACRVDTDCPAALPACKDNACIQCDGDEYCPPEAPKCKGQTCRVQ